MPLSDYDPIFQAAGREWNVDPTLLKAMARRESNGVTNAVSPMGAQGLMQIMPDTQKDLGVTDPNDVVQSIYGSAKYLSQLLDKYNNPTTAIAAYNAGPKRIDDVLAGRAQLPAETAAYVPAIVANYKQFAASPAQQQSGDDLNSVMSRLRSGASPAPANDVSSMSDSDFLNATGGPGALKLDDDATFLEKTGGKAPEAATPAKAPPTPAPAVEADTLATAPEGPVASSIREALAPAPNTTYGNVIPLAKDNTTGEIRFALPNSIRDLANGVLDLTQGPVTGTVTPAGTMALASGVIPGGLKVSPAADTGAPIAAAATNRLLQQEAPLSPAFKQAPFAPSVPATTNPLSPQAVPVGAAPAVNPLSGPVSAVPPSTLGVGPAPVRVPISALPPGAAQPSVSAPPGRILPILTQNQANAEADRILQHFAGGPVTVNANPLASGARPTLSQAIAGGNAGISGLERTVREMTPQAQNAFVEREAANQAARADALQKITGTPADIAAAEAERDAATAKARAAVFDPGNMKPTDPTPVVEKIADILGSDQGQRTVVASSLDNILSKIVSKDGTLQTDPLQLYGVRQAINDMISPKAAGTASDARQAARQLMAVRDALDPVIEEGAPGFKSYIKDYSDKTAPINGMQYLQNMRLTDAKGNIQLGKLNNAINALERQQAMPGARLADGVTDEQLKALKTLRSEFQNDQKQTLGVAIGSPTVQKLGANAIMSNLGHPVINALTSGGIGIGINPAAALPAALAGYGLRTMSSRGQQMVQEALRNKLLNPETAQNAFRKP